VVPRLAGDLVAVVVCGDGFCGQNRGGEIFFFLQGVGREDSKSGKDELVVIEKALGTPGILLVRRQWT